MTLLSYSNADAEYTDETKLAEGAEVLARFTDIKTILNGGLLDATDNINAAAVFPWTARHSWTISDTANNNLSLTVNGVMAAGKYGSYYYSNAAQINSALLYAHLDNASSTVPIFEYLNDGTGDTVKVTNVNTGSCFLAVTTSTGYPYEATIRDLEDLHTPLVSKVLTTATTLSADTTETEVTDLTVTLPADYLKVGSTIKGTIYGLIDTPGAGPADIRIYIKYGGTAGTILLDSGAVTPAVSLADSLVRIEYQLTVLSIGAAGTIEAQGILTFNSNTAPANRGLGTAGTGATNGAPIAIDTTSEKDLILSVVWSAATAGCNIEIRSGVIEIKQ